MAGRMSAALRVAIVGPRQAVLEQIELSDASLAPHEVLLRIRHSLISPGTELAYYAGGQSLNHRPDPYPFYPGYAAAGEVIDAGAEAPVRPGDLILAHAPHQSVARIDSRRTVCLRLPEGLALDLAPFARLGQVGAVSMRLMQARAGDRASVVGLGLVGNLVAQLLRSAGLSVLGVEPLAERRAMAGQCGIVETIDPAVLRGERAERADLLASCAVVIECSGQDQGVLGALALAAPHGEIFLVGAAWRRGTAVVAADIVRPIFDKYLALRSGWEWQIPLYGTAPPGSIAGTTAWVLACLRDESLRVRDLITDRVAPADANAAYADLLDHPGEHAGILIDWPG